MRFVIAVVALVLAAAGIGLGVAQRTILAGPDSLSSEVSTAAAPLTLIDGATLNANAGTQALEVAGEGTILLAYGRTADVRAWIGDASYNEVTWDAEAGELQTRLVAGTETVVPNPAGSDLWVREFSGDDLLTRKINAPSDISVLIAADGEQPAPADIRITWPLDNSAPLSGPLIIAGVVLALLGLAAFLWALVHQRGRRGPRRSTPRMPKPPKPPKLTARRSRGLAPELEVTLPRRPGAGRRRAFVAASGLALGALLLSGCSTGSAAPAPTPTPTNPLATIPVAVTADQFARIVTSAAATVAEADAAGDATLAAERLTGAALALRTANYKIRKADAKVAALAPIPDASIEITLPRQTDVWPRTVFGVVRATDGSAMGLMFTQESPRENYKIAYAVSLVADVPDVAPVEIGAPQLDPTNTFGIVAPDALAAAYGSILIQGEESPSYALFRAEGDTLREAIGFDAKEARRTALPSSARIRFTNGPGDSEPIAFGTNDSGQIVAVLLDDVETVTPVEAGAAINPLGQVKALSGKTQSTRGIRAVYGVQLLLYVPPAGSSEQIVLLGYAQGLVSATEVG